MRQTIRMDLNRVEGDMEVRLELDAVGRPSTQKPCLSDPLERRCRTADKVGYACYGCIGPKFPLSRPLFRHREVDARAA